MSYTEINLTDLVYNVLKEDSEFLGNIRMLLTTPVLDGPYEVRLEWIEMVSELNTIVSDEAIPQTTGFNYTLVSSLMEEVDWDYLLDLVLENA